MDDKHKRFLPLHSSRHSLPPLRRNCTCLLKVDPGRKKKHDWNYWLCSGCTDREIWYYRKQAQRLATCSWCITLCICRCFYPNWLILLAIHFISNVFPGNQTHAEQEHTCWAFCSSGDAGSRPHFTSPFTKNDYSVRKKKLSVITTLITNQIFAFITTAAS